MARAKKERVIKMSNGLRELREIEHAVEMELLGHTVELGDDLPSDYDPNYNYDKDLDADYFNQFDEEEYDLDDIES